ncbi:MAG: superoxide dismutase [Candidatus Falkowbacteria bacterium]
MFTLSLLPFEKNALEPYISSKTLDFHYGKHHQAYVDNLNKLILDSDLEAKSLENIILDTASDVSRAGIFNNAAQMYNHDFFWKSLRPVGVSSEPGEKLLALINKSFGSLENFYTELKAAALAQFGSGWAWLVLEGEILKIFKTANADTPIVHGLKPVLTIDVWEHAYYLDYQNRRADFVEGILKNILNWEFATSNL